MDHSKRTSGAGERGRLAAAGIGLVAGLLNGLIAIGGGIVIVPGLIRYRGASPQVAVGTSLATIVVLSAIGFTAHYTFAVEPIDAIELTGAVLGGIAGAQAGAVILARLDTTRMLKLFALFIFAMSLRLLWQGLDLGGGQETTGAPPAWAFPIVGFASGVLSGVFGVGGGALILLSLAAFFAMPVHQGLALALAVNVTNALAGAFRHARAGRVLWPYVVSMVPSAVVGIAAGTALALRLPADGLRLVFGGFFLFMALRIGRQALSASG